LQRPAQEGVDAHQVKRYIDEQVETRIAQRVAEALNAFAAQYAHRQASTSGGSSEPTRLKVPLPTKFEGRNANDVDRFVNEMERYMDYNQLPEGRPRVEHASMYLVGVASTWWTHLATDTITQTDAQGRDHTVSVRSTINTWQEMKEKLLERFRPQLCEVTARIELDRLRQTGPVSDYTERFQRLIQLIPDMSMSDKVHRYVQGLKDQHRAEVRRGRPKDLDTATTLAAIYDADWTVAHRSSQRPSSNTGFNGPNAIARGNNGSGYRPPHHSNGSSGAAPMELSHMDHGMEPTMEVSEPTTLAAIHTSAPRFPLVKLTPEERERCMREGRCLRCRELGHLARDCNLTRMAPRPNPSQSNIRGGQ
jgi:hypothetical protein